MKGGTLRVLYDNKKLMRQCTDLKEAQKLFGGDKVLALKLLDRIDKLENAEVIKDIILIKPLRFHSLEGNRKGEFAIDVKTKREPWRVILQPLNDEEEEYMPCNIDVIAAKAKVVRVKEVSDHYE